MVRKYEIKRWWLDQWWWLKCCTASNCCKMLLSRMCCWLQTICIDTMKCNQHNDRTIVITNPLQTRARLNPSPAAVCIPSCAGLGNSIQLVYNLLSTSSIFSIHMWRRTHDCLPDINGCQQWNQQICDQPPGQIITMTRVSRGGAASHNYAVIAVISMGYSWRG